MVPFLKATKVIQPLRGGSKPFLVSCNDDQLYVVKFQNNPQGRRILVNELLASELARQLDLPIAPTAIIQTDCDLVFDSAPFASDHGAVRPEFPSGPQIGSLFVPKPFCGGAFTFLSDYSLCKLDNLDRFLDILVFDIWTGNVDRRQFVFHRTRRGGPMTATMIDQGYCFGGRSWDLSNIGPIQPYERKVVYNHVQDFGCLNRAIQKLDQIDDSLLRRIVDSIPGDWLRG